MHAPQDQTHSVPVRRAVVQAHSATPRLRLFGAQFHSFVALGPCADVRKLHAILFSRFQSASANVLAQLVPLALLPKDVTRGVWISPPLTPRSLLLFALTVLVQVPLALEQSLRLALVRRVRLRCASAQDQLILA